MGFSAIWKAVGPNSCRGRMYCWFHATS